jgi:hypothetical protein
MNSTPPVSVPLPPEFSAVDEARKLARAPDSIHVSASGKDTVELSPEAIALFMSRNDVIASMQLIRTENGVGDTLLDILR